MPNFLDSFLTDDLTDGMQSSYGLACAGFTNGPQCFAASATHYVPEILLQVCLRLIF